MRCFAPETLRDETKFTKESLMWQFGILYWEILTRGHVPYDQLQVSGSSLKFKPLSSQWVCIAPWQGNFNKCRVLTHSLCLELAVNIEKGVRCRQPLECDLTLYKVGESIVNRTHYLDFKVMLACWHPDPMQRPILKHIIDFMKQYEIELTTREASMFIKKYSNKRACEVRHDIIVEMTILRNSIMQKTRCVESKTRRPNYRSLSKNVCIVFDMVIIRLPEPPFRIWDWSQKRN